ncbi:MAG: histidine triad nucleotide-binding protein [Candidatus Terrybacteria bacterium RIFCSPHIGHO2_01_FULL_48_17]|uniref:Histidine triad nucleotide-binding protein n=1 Tax=Candidatus Terrybacteria bacterium RIFCSPHIGHO2_01_FULL_48_17 TaxID=1802362 RepID=A0A1G2PIW3_9BACT|nr:MAG: histidine triad nucleotide-binding protein [Candidatus Terrybacteria bacterium RIFCSPHIGHO2_01_FULL_48_17]OHA52241.1 MAG: histidine triad nucleotide-binding protein [Candidatus Terrybacteria bacterium RIFCSPLOWO2_01_FULL_48_14]
MGCIFCEIINRGQKGDIIFETKELVAFKDIHPKAPVHILVVPRQHIVSLVDTDASRREILGNLFSAAADIARMQGIAESGFKVVMNVGRGGGQIIDHLHVHVLGGWKEEDNRELP